jgi:hypothetical protein
MKRGRPTITDKRKMMPSTITPTAIQIATERAKELGMSRSRYIEELILGNI